MSQVQKNNILNFILIDNYYRAYHFYGENHLLKQVRYTDESHKCKKVIRAKTDQRE